MPGASKRWKPASYFGGQDVAGGAALGRSIYVLLDESSYIPHTEGKAKWTDPSTPGFFFFFWSLVSY